MLQLQPQFVVANSGEDKFDPGGHLAMHSPLLANDFSLLAMHSTHLANDSPLLAKHFSLIGNDSPLTANDFSLMAKYSPHLANDSTLLANDFSRSVSHSSRFDKLILKYFFHFLTIYFILT